MNKFGYNIDWLINTYDNKPDVSFLFFWGHTNTANLEVGNYCFSQWFELPFIVNNITYLTAEHWMMACKALLFNDLITYQKIIEAKKPGEVKSLGREVANFDEQIWDKCKFEIVKNGNIHKFNQHPQFAEFLLNTDDKILVEASPVDMVWGIGMAKGDENINNPYCWEGLNLLGFALMEVRDLIKDCGHFTYLETPVALPWLVEPRKDPYDLFWRMGKGEDLITNFSRNYDSLSDRDKFVLKISNPSPYSWKEFFD